MIEIEFPEPTISKCSCCGGRTTNLTRFVNKDGEAFAIYYAAFSDDHPESRLIGVISLGDWAEEYVPETRVAFGFEMWCDAGNFAVCVIDAARTPWADAEIIGRKLTRDQALVHPWLHDAFHITDHMTIDDPAVRAFFETVH